MSISKNPSIQIHILACVCMCVRMSPCMHTVLCVCLYSINSVPRQCCQTYVNSHIYENLVASAQGTRPFALSTQELRLASAALFWYYCVGAGKEHSGISEYLRQKYGWGRVLDGWSDAVVITSLVKLCVEWYAFPPCYGNSRNIRKLNSSLNFSMNFSPLNELPSQFLCADCVLLLSDSSPGNEELKQLQGNKNWDILQTFR